MSDEPSAKRQRVDDSSSLAAPTSPPATDYARIEELQAKILDISPATFQAFASVVATAEPSGLLARLIDQEHARLQAQERAKAAQAIDFSKYARKANYVFNKQYEHLSGSREFHAAGDAQSTLEAMLDDMVKRTKDISVYATKKSAVDTMRRIFEIMLNSPSVIGKEIRNDCYDWDSKFLQVMGKFTEEELERLATEDAGAWVNKFRALVDEAEYHCILEKLQESLDDLEAYQFGGEDENGEDGMKEEDGEGKENEHEASG